MPCLPRARAPFAAVILFQPVSRGTALIWINHSAASTNNDARGSDLARLRGGQALFPYRAISTYRQHYRIHEMIRMPHHSAARGASKGKSETSYEQEKGPSLVSLPAMG